MDYKEYIQMVYNISHLVIDLCHKNKTHVVNKDCYPNPVFPSNETHMLEMFSTHVFISFPTQKCVLGRDA